MEQLFKIETTLTGELAELYAGLMAEFESRSDISLSEMNRAVLQTGIVHHLTMMRGLGLLDGEEGDRIEALVDSVANETIMWEVVRLARDYWKNSNSGSIDLKA